MYPTWKGIDIRPSRTADLEMVRLRIYLDDVCRVLEEGYDYSKSKRRRGTFERCLRIRGRIVKVVVVTSVTNWNNEPVWLITHVGEIHGK